MAFDLNIPISLWINIEINYSKINETHKDIIIDGYTILNFNEFSFGVKIGVVKDLKHYKLEEQFKSIFNIFDGHYLLNTLLNLFKTTSFSLARADSYDELQNFLNDHSEDIYTIDYWQINIDIESNYLPGLFNPFGYSSLVIYQNYEQLSYFKGHKIMNKLEFDNDIDYKRIRRLDKLLELKKIDYI